MQREVARGDVFLLTPSREFSFRDRLLGIVSKPRKLTVLEKTTKPTVNQVCIPGKQGVKKWIFLCLAVLAIIFPSEVGWSDPSWCSKARTETEKTICADETDSHYFDSLINFDKELNEMISRVYREISSVAERSSVRFDQRQWLKQRNKCGVDSDCIKRIYLSRLNALAALPAAKSLPIECPKEKRTGKVGAISFENEAVSEICYREGGRWVGVTKASCTSRILPSPGLPEIARERMNNWLTAPILEVEDVLEWSSVRCGPEDYDGHMYYKATVEDETRGTVTLMQAQGSYLVGNAHPYGTASYEVFVKETGERLAEGLLFPGEADEMVFRRLGKRSPWANVLATALKDPSGLKLEDSYSRENAEDGCPVPTNSHCLRIHKVDKKRGVVFVCGGRSTAHGNYACEFKEVLVVPWEKLGLMFRPDVVRNLRSSK
jgi:uncharacterized protein